MIPGRGLGRLPRAHDADVPVVHAQAEWIESPIPDAIDYAHGMPGNLGYLLNDDLGDCTAAAFYHARQVWTFHRDGRMEEERWLDALVLYAKCAHYRVNRPQTDNGAVEQHVLKYVVDVGAPIENCTTIDRVRGFAEVRKDDIDGVKRTIYNFGVAYIGFKMPEYIYRRPTLPKEWEFDPRATRIEGGHAVVLTGYDGGGAMFISWGARYKMSWAFFDRYVDEVYALIDDAWTGSERARDQKVMLPSGAALAGMRAALDPTLWYTRET